MHLVMVDWDHAGKNVVMEPADENKFDLDDSLEEV